MTAQLLARQNDRIRSARRMLAAAERAQSLGIRASVNKALVDLRSTRTSTIDERFDRHDNLAAAAARRLALARRLRNDAVAILIGGLQ